MSEKSNHKKKQNIILLEDEETLANLYSKKLKDAGFNVKNFFSVHELLEGFESASPDLAFLDYAIHGEEESGLDMIPKLREVFPDLPIVMLSNYSEFQMEEMAKEAGATDYLLKISTPPNVLVEYAKRLVG